MNFAVIDHIHLIERSFMSASLRVKIVDKNMCYPENSHLVFIQRFISVNSLSVSENYIIVFYIVIFVDDYQT